MKTSAMLSLLFAAAPVFADRDDYSVEYYLIDAATAREISAVIDSRGPVGENGRRSDGYTRWFIKWHFDPTADARGCVATNIQVDLDIHMIMPKWNPPASADPDVVARWKQYLEALQLHEDGHRYRAQAMAGDIRRALQREDRARDCKELTTRLNATANVMLAELRERQAAYDLETDSGRKQGVRRP